MSLTVVTAVYNDERFIAKSIESILGQTFMDFEYIIIDDGSTDKTPQILDTYARTDSRVRVITQNNAGPAAAKNTGIGLASSEYIVLQDSDDLSQPDRLSRLKLAFERATADVITSNYEVIAEDDSVICAFTKPINLVEKLEIGINPICHGATAFNINVLLAVGTFNPFYRDSEDYDLYLRLLESNARFIKLDKILYHYRLRQDSAMSSATDFYLKIAHKNHLRRRNGEHELFPSSKPVVLARPNPYPCRVADALFWSENYKAFRRYYIKNITSLWCKNRFTFYFLFAWLPDSARKKIKNNVIKLKKWRYFTYGLKRIHFS